MSSFSWGFDILDLAQTFLQGETLLWCTEDFGASGNVDLFAHFS